MLRVQTLVYVVQGGKVLMLRRGAHKKFLPNALVAPGGKVDPQETPEACAKREFVEETGLVVNDLHHAGTVFYTSNTEDNEAGVMYIYLANGFTGDFQAEVEDGILEWCDVEALLASGELMAGHQVFLENILNGNGDHYVSYAAWHDDVLTHFEDSNGFYEMMRKAG